MFKNVKNLKTEKIKNDIIIDYLPDRILRDFFMTDAIELAKNLLGKIIVRQTDDGEIIKCRIVENLLGKIFRVIT